jgi:hypothetical protein
MPEFDTNAYFADRFGKLSNNKAETIDAAMRQKLSGLQEYQKAAMAGQAFSDAERSVADVVGDVGVTALKSAIGLPEAFVGLADIATGGLAGKKLEEAGYRPGDAKKILDGWLSDAQQEANLRVESADGFVETLKAGVANPSVIATAVGESAASMLGGGVVARGLAGATKLAPVVAGAIGEGVLGAGAAAEQIRQGTVDGELTGKQVLSAVGSGAGTAILGFAGGKLAQKAGLPDVDTMMASGDLKSPAGFLKAVVGSGISEGVFEEMPQSAQEQMWQNFATDKPLLEGVGDASALGLLAGAAMGNAAGGVSGVAGIAQGVQEKVAEKKQVEAARAAAEASGDVSGLINPEAPGYAPSKAIDALMGNSKLESTTPEARAENLAKAEQVVAKLEAARTVYQKELEGSGQKRAELAQLKQQLAGMKDLESEEANDIRLDIKDLETDLAKPVDPKVTQRAQKKLAQTDRELAQARQSLKSLAYTVHTPEEASVAVEAVANGKSDEPVVQKAVARVLSMAVSASNLLSSATAKTLASNPASALNDEQRQYLNAYAEAQIAVAEAKSMDEVQQEVLFGSDKNIGIAQYRERVLSAVQAQDRRSVRRLMGQMNTFAAHHAAKAAVATQAIAGGRGTPIAKIDGVWKVLPKGTRQESVKATEFKVMNSERLVEAMQLESKALNASLAELQAAVSAFSQQPQAGTKDVKDTAQQGATQPEKRTVAKASGSGKAGTSELPKLDDSGSAVAKARPTDLVEPTGLSSETTQENSVLSVSADSTESSVDQERTAEDTEKTVEVADGKLSAFQQEPQEGATNLVREHFTQSEGSNKTASARPLVAKKDFLTALSKGEAKLSDFLADKTLTGEVGKAKAKTFRAFLKLAKEWQGSILSALPATRKQAGWEHQDMTDGLMFGEDGQLRMDENVLTAMAYSGFSYVASEATAPASADNKAVNSILGRGDKDAVSPNADKLRTVGTRQYLVLESLGANAMQALGLKAKATAPKNFEASMKQHLGARVLQMLLDAGLVEINTVPAMEIQAIREEGLDEFQVERVRKDFGFTAEDVAAYADSNHKKHAAVRAREISFVRVARGADGKVVELAESIYQANKGSQNVLDKLFGAEAGTVLPSLEPITELRLTTGKGEQQIPEYLKKVLLANQARPRTVRKANLRALGLLSEQFQQDVIGVVREDGSVPVHKARMKGIAAKNAGLVRQLKNFTEFVGDLALNEKGMDTPFYLPFNAWQQQRVGIESSAVNPQTSKVVRFLMGSPDWKSTVSSTDMNSFWLRVGEGLGVKTERAMLAKNLATVQSKVSNPVIQAGVDALRVTLDQSTTLDEAQQAAVVAAVKAGGENMHTLDVLMALAQQQEAEAKAKGQPYTFEVEMMGEVDGVANGTMLSHVLLGAKESVESLAEMMKQGGFYLKDTYTQYNQFRGTPGNLDIYESTGQKIHKALEWFKQTNPRDVEAVNALTFVGGALFSAKDGVTKEARNVVKEALNPLAFGSSMGNVTNLMANGLIEKIYVGFEKMANKVPAVAQAEVDAYVKQVNVLLGNARKLEVGKPIVDYLVNPFTLSQQKAIAKTYRNTMGKVVKEVIQTEFASFLEKRDMLADATVKTFQLYDAVYKGVREAFVNELAEAGQLPMSPPNQKTGERKIIGDLSKKQEKELAKRMRSIAPTMKTLMSKADNNALHDLFMAKVSRKQSNSPLYAGEVRFASNEEGKKTKTVRTHGVVTENVDPGVLMVSASTHSSDSFISHAVQEIMDVLNIHDALGAGLNGMTQAAKALNQKTFEALVNYSPLAEAYASLSNVVQGIAQNSEHFGMYPEVVRNLEAFAKDTDLANSMASLKAAAAKSDRIRLEFLAQVVSVDQYAFEGGNFVVTPEAKASIEKQLAALSELVPEKDKAAIKSIESALAEGFATKAEEPETVMVEGGVFEEANDEGDNSVSEQADPADKFMPSLSNVAAAQILKVIGTDAAKAVLAALMKGKNLVEAMKALSDVDASSLRTAVAAKLDAAKPSFWGEVGTPNVSADAAVVEFFEKTANPTIGNVIEFLEQHMKSLNQTRHVKFQSLLLEQLKRTADMGVAVNYITKSTPPSLADHAPPSAARGWYVSNGEGVYILSPDFKHSAVTPEVLLHELVHDALIKAVANPNKRTQGMVNELGRLMEKAAEFIKANGLTDKHGEAVSNLDEFIAWGMTNRGFQSEVLSKLDMGSRTKSNGLITGMKEFIAKVTGILFAGSALQDNEQARNGMAILVSNVSGLFAEAANQKEKATSKEEKRILKMAAAVRSYTTQDIFEVLNDGTTGAAFQEHLGGLLSSIVQKLHGPLGSLKAGLMQQQTLSPLDVWLKALDTGAAPFASEVVSAGLASQSQQQAFVIEQVEATVRAALDGNEAQTKLVYSALNKLYTEAEQKLSVKDFLAAGFTEAQYQFVFTPTKSNGDRSAYLSRFAAMGLAHEGFNKMLQFNTKVIETEPKSIAEKLQRVFEQILDFFQRSLTGTYAGQSADNKLQILVGKLVDIEAQRKERLVKAAVTDGLQDSIEKGVQKAFDGMRKKAVEFSKSKKLRENGSGYVRGAGALLETVAGDKVEALLDTLAKLRDREMAGRYGVMASVVREVTGLKAQLQAYTRNKTNHDRKRKAIMNSTAKTVLESFVNGGANLSMVAKASISQVFLRTGAHHLLGAYSLQELESMLGKGKALDDAIEAAEKALGAFGKRAPYFMNQANVLGHYAATGKVSDASMMMNAHNIVEMVGTPYHGKWAPEKVAEARPMIERLVALYALRYTDTAQMSTAQEVLRAEMARTDGMNGVEVSLLLHKQLEKDSLDKLFKGNPALMVHGYTPDIYNPHIGLTVANEADGQDLVMRGYVKQGAVQLDPADQDTEKKHIYVLAHGGLKPYLAGAMNLTGLRAKGSPLHNGFMNLKYPEGVENASKLAAMTNGTVRTAALSRMFQPGPVTDLSQVKTAFMAPVVNEKGDVVNWRYLMTQESKDKLLERTNGFDKILGTLASTTYDKATAAEQNREVLTGLRDLYNEEGARNQSEYIEVSAGSPDREMREIWNMLPDATKELALSIWGERPMMVRKDSLDLVFGYRKLSLSSIFEKDAGLRSELEKVIAAAVEYPMSLYAGVHLGKDQNEAREWASKRSAVAVSRGEQMWQELVREAKDIIVVKTGVVLVGNVISNLSLLWAQGVPLKDMLHHHLVAMRGATAYINDSEELSRLNILLSAGLSGDEAEAVRKQIIRLEDSLARNPVGELIEAGLMPSIVEDVAADDDPYSYKSALVRKVDGVASKMNDKVVAGARIAYMAHDTKLYKGLSRATQLSDFVARYTLYQHLTSKKNGALTKADAIHEASEAFVNYDIPMHRALQYMDDMGLMMFTKYFMRIQRVLMKTARENPGRMLSMAVFNSFYDIGPIVLDSSAVFHVGNNPFNAGPLTLMTSLDDLATITAPMSLVK